MTRIWVWAPNADAVAVDLFDVDDRPAGRFELQPEPDGHWGADIEASVGMRYTLLLRHGTDETHRIDPRAREVTNSVGKSVITELDFPWTDEAFEARPLNEWAIYELHPGTFGGTLGDAAERLQHLADLGVTVIELMPVAEFAGDVSWGYNPAMPFAVESSYGGPAALRHFVNTAHGYGIAVVLDVVYNHLGPSDLDLWRFDGWSEGDGGGIYFFNDWRAETPWGSTRPDYGRPEVCRYLIDNALMWIGEYHLDGLRVDSTINIHTVHGHAGGGDLPEGWSFLQDLTSTVHAAHPGAVLIAEDLQNDPRVTQPVAEGGLGFDLQWSAAFVHTVRSALSAVADEDRDVAAVADAVDGGGPDAWRRVVYTESHDEVANGSTRVPSEIDPATPGSAAAIRRAAIGAVLMMMAPGVPMLFQGQEWADEDWFDDTNPLRWERRDERPGIVRMWSDLIHLRVGEAGGLRGDAVSCAQTGELGQVLIIRRWGLGGEDAATVGVVNLSASTVDGIRFDEGSSWHCAFSSDWSGYHASGSDAPLDLVDGTLTLPSYGAAIFVPVGQQPTPDVTPTR